MTGDFGGTDVAEARIRVPEASTYAVLLAVAAAANLVVAVGGTAVPAAFRALSLVAALAAASAAAWFAWFVGRVRLDREHLVLHGVYRRRSLARAEVSALETVEGRWPGRGSPAVWPWGGPAHYLVVRRSDGDTCAPPAFCSLTSADLRSSVPHAVAVINSALTGARPGS